MGGAQFARFPMSCPFAASFGDRERRASLRVARVAGSHAADAFRSMGFLSLALREERMVHDIDTLIVELELSRCWVVGCVGCAMK